MPQRAKIFNGGSCIPVRESVSKTRMSSDYELVTLRNGASSLRSVRYGETLHPGVGPALEGDSLYVQQLGLRERVAQSTERFVVWDVGLGAGANAIAAFRALPPRLHVISFDNTLEPLEFAVEHSATLGYFSVYETPARELIRNGRVAFEDNLWETIITDFPSFLSRPEATRLSPPRAIFYDPFSPERNPEMWTLPHFANLFRCLREPCALATYSRSTLIRVTLLLAGFYVGVGMATGLKEETTIAANRLDLVEQPLGRAWLRRAERSHSAEPLLEPAYRKLRLSKESLARLEAHPQFCSHTPNSLP